MRHLSPLLFPLLALAAATTPTGKLIIECEADVAVAIAGRELRHTRYREQGLLNTELPVGVHRVVLTKPGFRPDERHITVTADSVIVLAVFEWQPASAIASPSRHPPDELLKRLREAVAREAEAWQRYRDEPSRGGGITSAPPYPGAPLELYSPLAMANSEWQAASAMAIGAERDASTQFRCEYARFLDTLSDPRTDDREKRAAWQTLAARWSFSPDDGPAALVWRHHRVEPARGGLRIVCSVPWPAQLGTPTFRLGNRDLLLEPAPTQTTAPQTAWEFHRLVAATHTVRIEHPAIHTAEVAVPIRDRSTTTIRFTPQFKQSIASP